MRACIQRELPAPPLPYTHTPRHAYVNPMTSLAFCIDMYHTYSTPGLLQFYRKCEAQVDSGARRGRGTAPQRHEAVSLALSLTSGCGITDFASPVQVPRSEHASQMLPAAANFVLFLATCCLVC